MHFNMLRFKSLFLLSGIHKSMTHRILIFSSSNLQTFFKLSSNYLFMFSKCSLKSYRFWKNKLLSFKSLYGNSIPLSKSTQDDNLSKLLTLIFVCYCYHFIFCSSFQSPAFNDSFEYTNVESCIRFFFYFQKIFF